MTTTPTTTKKEEEEHCLSPMKQNNNDHRPVRAVVAASHRAACILSQNEHSQQPELQEVPANLYYHVATLYWALVGKCRVPTRTRPNAGFHWWLTTVAYCLRGGTTNTRVCSINGCDGAQRHRLGSCSAGVVVFALVAEKNNNNDNDTPSSE